MKSILKKILPHKKEKENFLVVDIGLDRLTVAVFKPEVATGRTAMTPRLLGLSRSEGLGDKSFQEILTTSLNSLTAIVGPLPKKVLLGVSGFGVFTATVVARYQRPDPNKTITEEEITQVLEKSADQVVLDQKTPDLKLFFSSVTWASTDGAKIVNPVGSKGADVEVSCFHSFKSDTELRVWDQVLTDSGFEIQKIVPTAFALSKIIIRNGIQNLIMMRVSEGRCEISFITDTNIAEIAAFDLGFKDHELLTQAVEILLAEIKLPKGIPDVIWIYPEGKEEPVQRIRTSLLEINWQKDFGRSIPNIRLGQKPEGFSLDDTPLIALGLEAVR